MNSPTIDFAGQYLFIGIDTHARQWKITVRTQNIPLRTLSINPDPKDLRTFLHKHYRGAHCRSVYEVGFLWILDTSTITRVWYPQFRVRTIRQLKKG